MAKQNFTNPKPGTYFEAESGKIRIFSHSNIIVMKAWPPIAWQKTAEHPAWAHVRPEIKLPCGDIESEILRLELSAEENGQLLLPFKSPLWVRKKHGQRLAWLKWYAGIPPEVRQMVHRFPKRQWHMLSFIARCGGPAADLVQSNPALAFALANNWIFHKPAVQRPLRSARALLGLGKKQREILRWLGFPGSNAGRKILGKVLSCAISIPNLLYLRQAMEDPDVFKMMSHLSWLNAGVIRIITDPRLLPLVTFSFLEELANYHGEDRWANAAYMLLDSMEMFHIVPATAFPRPIRELDQLQVFHDVLVEETNRLDRKALDIPFPPPPLQGTDTIMPITNAEELAEEGRVQKNCVASYLKRVVISQRTYIYRVLQPERCTLALEQNATGSWHLSELKAACNNQPHTSTWEAVKNWYESQTGKQAIFTIPAFEACYVPCGARVDHDFDFDADDVPF